MVGARFAGRCRWFGPVAVSAAVVAGCSTGPTGSAHNDDNPPTATERVAKEQGTVLEMGSGDRFAVVLPRGWAVEPSDSNDVFLFGKSEGAIFVDETDTPLVNCAPAVQCAENRHNLLGGEVTEVVIGGLTYYRHRYEAAWAGGERKHYYVDWHDRTYAFTISFPNDPEVVESVVGSIVWQE